MSDLPGKSNAINRFRVLPILLLLVIMVCGYLVSYSLFAKPRGFKGDFYAAMYDPNWWDGKGVIYGPIFVFERWIVNSFPRLATVEFFAITSLILLLLCLLISIRTVKARENLLIFCIASWSLNPFFYYSFSVAANPEILELFFLLSMWWSFTRKHFKLAYFVFTCAVLTKLAPLILAPLLLLSFSWGGIALILFLTFAIFSIVSLGQSQSLWDSLTQTLSVSPVDPQPTSEQFLGLNSALSRLSGLDINSNFHVIDTLSIVILISLYAYAILFLVSTFHSRTDHGHQEVVTYFFALFMTLLPLMHLGQAHRHTYIFLAPVFIAMKYLTTFITDLKQQRRYDYTFNAIFLAHSLLPIYALDIYNFDDLQGVVFLGELEASLVMLTEPVWINIFLFFAILRFGKSVLNLKVTDCLTVITRKSRLRAI